MASLSTEVAEFAAAAEPTSIIQRLQTTQSRIDDYEILVYFDDPPPVGWLAQQLTLLDRTFRLAARFAESDEPVDEFLSRRHRGIPVAEGLITEALAIGSLRVRLRPSERIRAQFKKRGLAELALAVGILNGSVDFVDKIAPEPVQQQHPDVIYMVPSPPPVHHEIRIHLKRGDETADIFLVEDGGDSYNVLPPGRLPKHLEP